MVAYNSKIIKKLDEIDIKTKDAFGKVKQEFSDHLDSINENSSEIQSNYEYLMRLENKIDKLEQNLSEIHRFISQFKNQHSYNIEEEQSSFMVQPLTDNEKRVFKALYELEAQEIKVTYANLSSTLGISLSLAREYVLTMIEKGVPIIKSYLHQVVFLSLEPRFKEAQTKENIVEI